MRRAFAPLALVACASTTAYDRARDRWTREATDLRLFDTALDVDATLRSWEFRRAYAEREIAWFRLEGASAEEVRTREAAAHAGAVEFFLAVRTHSEKWNDFDAREPSWRLVLVDDRGRSVEPLGIDTIDVTPALREFFPQSDTFARAYRVRFPKTHADGGAVLDARAITLRISGPLGSADLVWRLR